MHLVFSLPEAFVVPNGPVDAHLIRGAPHFTGHRLPVIISHLTLTFLLLYSIYCLDISLFCLAFCSTFSFCLYSVRRKEQAADKN